MLFRSNASCVRAPCARCTRGGLSGALMRQHAQWQGLAWRSRLAAAPRVCPLRVRPPPCAQRGTSLRLGAPGVRAPCARCTCGGLSGALMRQPAQWQGLAWRGWLAAAPRVYPLRVRPPPPLCPAWHLAAPRCSLCARALRPLYMWWAIGGQHASACTIAGPGVQRFGVSDFAPPPMAPPLPPPQRGVPSGGGETHPPQKRNCGLCHCTHGCI